MTYDEEDELINKTRITVKEAIDILNRYHYGSDSSIKDGGYPLPWKWARYKDCGYIRGVAVTKNLKAKYAHDKDLGDEPHILSDFAAIAIAEALLAYATSPPEKQCPNPSSN